MFRRKNKEQADQNNGRRVPLRPGQASPNPTFSYYASRTTTSGERAMREQNRPVASDSKAPRRLSLTARLPLSLLLVIAVVCAVKLLLLGTDPKVIILGKNTVSATYVQPSGVYEAAAQKVLRSSVANRVKLTASLSSTARSLEQQFPELSAVSVTLPLVGNRPIVYAEVAQPSVLLQSTSGTYALNKSGLVLARITTQPAGVPMLVDQSGVVPQPGKQFLPSSTISFVQTMHYQLTAAGHTVANFVLPRGNTYELDVRLDGKPFVIRCNIESDALVQSGAAIGTLQQLGATTPTSYIDVRVPGRVYYK